MAEELWSRLGHSNSLAYEPFPKVSTFLILIVTLYSSSRSHPSERRMDTCFSLIYLLLLKRGAKSPTPCCIASRYHLSTFLVV